jgi:predicted outer membrane repeat protein
MRYLGLFIPLMAACGSGGQDVGTTGSLVLEPDALDFGAVEIGTTAVLGITLSNPGDTSVEVLSVSLVEGSTSLWAVDRNGVDVVVGRTSEEVLVQFTPVDTAPELARVQIRSSDDEQPSVFVSVQGAGALSTVDGDGDGYSPADGDCDDENPMVNPGEEEICDGLDTDCDGITPVDESDDDFDGFTVCAGDCDDDEDAVYPGAVEICDGLDNDCVPGGDENEDLDGDGQTPCEGDCNDRDIDVFDGAVEMCDGVDNDCDGGIDDLDADGDGHSLCSETGDCDDSDPDAYPVVVSTTGNVGGLGTDADPYDSIATALENLDEVCHEIHLLPGSYETDVQVDGEVVSVFGGTPADTTLTAPVDSRILLVSNGAEVRLEGVTLTGGNAATDGGAVKVESGGVLSLTDVVVEANSSAADGGAIAVSSASLLLEEGCAFLNNDAVDDGGALALLSPVLFSDRGSTYVGNTAASAGAISVFGGTVDLSDQWFESNVSSLGDGGAIQVSGGGSFLLERSHFQFNTAAAAGGAVALTDVDDVDGWVRNLTAASNSAGTDGGALTINGSSAALSVTNNTLVGNTAAGHGGGLHVGVAEASGLQVRSNLVGWSNAASGLFIAVGSAAQVDFNTSFATSTLVEFGGAVSDGVDENVARDPLFVVFTDDGLPGNDDLGLQLGSLERDAGPPAYTMNDTDGSQNDRGASGGPGATP